MGIVSGLVLGILVGFGLVAGWYFMILRRSRLRILKAANIKLLGRMTQDEVKKLLSNFFPPWVIFPEFERVKWLNRQLGLTLLRGVEPVLDLYRPAAISALKFNKLFLGHIANSC